MNKTCRSSGNIVQFVTFIVLSLNFLTFKNVFAHGGVPDVAKKKQVENVLDQLVLDWASDAFKICSENPLLLQQSRTFPLTTITGKRVMLYCLAFSRHSLVSHP